MENNKTLTEELSWDFEGSGHFKATLTNKQISNLQFCFNGNDDNNCLKSTDKKHLSNIHKALGELLAYMDADLNRNGDTEA
jgi:hypothetical protein